MNNEKIFNSDQAKKWKEILQQPKEIQDILKKEWLKEGGLSYWDCKKCNIHITLSDNEERVRVSKAEGCCCQPCYNANEKIYRQCLENEQGFCEGCFQDEYFKNIFQN